MVIPDAHFATCQSVFVPGLLGILMEPDGFSHRLLLHTFLRHTLNVLPPRHIPVSCPLVFPAPVHIFIGCGFQLVNVPQLIIMRNQVVMGIPNLYRIVQFAGKFYPPGIDGRQSVLSQHFLRTICQSFHLSIRVFGMQD